MKRLIPLILSIAMPFTAAIAQPEHNPGSNHGNRFEQLDYLLATPNEYRTASGAPGPKYWQQRADYDIKVEIDEERNILTGSETVTYYNNSPDPLSYIWLQLDENFHHAKSDNNRDNAGKMSTRMTDRQLSEMNVDKTYEGYGLNLTKVTDA